MSRARSGARHPLTVLVIAVDDPAEADVAALLATHVSFAREVTPPGHVHALDAGGLSADHVTLYSARSDGALLAVGALRALDDRHGEIKSMHTTAAARGRGVGRAMVEHLLAVARDRGYERVSLETGTYDAFAAARALYASVGFEGCAPFADYTDNTYSICMTIALAVQ